MRDFTDELRELRRRLGEAEVYLRVAESRNRLTELEAEMGRPDLWDDANAAKALSGEYANVRDDLATYDALAGQLDDVEVLHELARDEDDETQEPEIAEGIATVTRGLDQLDLRSLFTGEHDEADCIVQINAKDGGVDAQDWSEILLRMYGRWAERRKFGFEVDAISEGTEAGILSAEFTITGRYAYGTRPTGLRRLQPTFRRAGLEALRPVVWLLRSIGDGYGKTPGQVALRWLLDHDGVLPIPGAKSAEQATHNAGALSFTLTPAEIADLDHATTRWRPA